MCDAPLLADGTLQPLRECRSDFLGLFVFLDEEVRRRVISEAGREPEERVARIRREAEAITREPHVRSGHFMREAALQNIQLGVGDMSAGETIARLSTSSSEKAHVGRRQTPSHTRLQRRDIPLGAALDWFVRATLDPLQGPLD